MEVDVWQTCLQASVSTLKKHEESEDSPVFSVNHSLRYANEDMNVNDNVIPFCAPVSPHYVLEHYELETSPSAS